MISRGELKEVGLVPPLWVRLHPMFQMRREKYSVLTYTLSKKLDTKYISYWPNIRKSLYHKTSTSWPWFFIIQHKTHLQSAHLDAIHLCLKAHFLKERNKTCIPQSSLLQVGNCYFFWGKKVITTYFYCAIECALLEYLN